MRGSGPTRGGIANAVGTNEYQTNAADLDPGSLRASGCSGVADVSRCVELALNVAIDENSVTRHALAIFATEEVQPPVRPLAVPYDSLFAAGPAAIDTEKRPGIQRRITSGGTTRLLFDALALPLRTHSEVLATLRSSNPAWAALNDAQLLARRPIIHIELNGLVLGNVAPPPLCNADINRACSLRVFERPGGAIDQCPFDQSGLCATPLRSRGAYGGLATEFAYTAGSATPPTFSHWDLRGAIAGEQPANGGQLEQTLCVDGLTHPSLCVQGLVWSYPPHLPITGRFTELPARVGMVAQTARGWGYSVEGVAAALNARTSTLYGEVEFLERPLTESFAYTPIDAINGFARGMPVFRLESVTREALVELGAKRFDLSAVTQGEFGDMHRRAPVDINAFQFSPVSFVGELVTAHTRTAPSPVVNVRVHPEAMPMVTEVRVTDGEGHQWSLSRVAGDLGLFRAALNGVAAGGVATQSGSLRVDALANGNAVQGLVGFDRIPLIIHTDSEDSDFDGVLDRGDNCPRRSNTPQADIDGDGQGDLCDDDMDGDGLRNEAEMGGGTDPRSPDTDGDGVRDNVEAARGSDPRMSDSDHDGVPDGQDSPLADDDCDGIANSRDNLNDRIGQVSPALFFKGVRNSTFELTLLKREQDQNGRDIDYPIHVTARVRGATWWLPATTDSEGADSLGLTLQSASLQAGQGFQFQPYFVAARPREYTFGAPSEDYTISSLEVTWSDFRGPTQWGYHNEDRRRPKGAAAHWVIRGCPGMGNPNQYWMLDVPGDAGQLLRSPSVQRCIADSLRGVAGYVGTAQSQGRTLCGGSDSMYTRMLKINDWNADPFGLNPPGMPRIILCKTLPVEGGDLDRRPDLNECIPVSDFRREGCDVPDGSDCGAGITLASITKAYAINSTLNLTQTVPSFNTNVSPDPNSIWVPTERTVFGKSPALGSPDYVFAASSGGTELPVNREGNTAPVARLALHSTSQSAETWTPQFTSVVLRPPGARSDPPPNQPVVLWISDLDGLRGNGQQNAEIIIKNVDVPGNPTRELPFRILIAEALPTTMQGLPYEVSPSAQVCRQGRGDAFNFAPSPGGRAAGAHDARVLVEGLARAGRTTTIEWNGRLGCGANVIRDAQNPDRYRLQPIIAQQGRRNLQPGIAPLRPGQYRLIVETYLPCRVGNAYAVLTQTECNVADVAAVSTRTNLNDNCFRADGGPRYFELTFNIGMEFNVGTGAGSIRNHARPALPLQSWFDLSSEANAAPLRTALVNSSNALIQNYFGSAAAIRFIQAPVARRGWWLPSIFANSNKTNPSFCPLHFGDGPPAAAGFSPVNRWYSDGSHPNFGALDAAGVEGCVDMNTEIPEEINGLIGVADPVKCPGLPTRQCRVHLIGNPVRPTMTMTTQQKSVFLTQAYSAAFVHEALHTVGVFHTTGEDPNLLNQRAGELFAP